MCLALDFEEKGLEEMFEMFPEMKKRVSMLAWEVRWILEKRVSASLEAGMREGNVVRVRYISSGLEIPKKISVRLGHTKSGSTMDSKIINLISVLKEASKYNPDIVGDNRG